MNTVTFVVNLKISDKTTPMNHWLFFYSLFLNFTYLFVVFIPVLRIWSFENSACNSTDNTAIGTCVTTQTCRKMNGDFLNTCANGYGVCCKSE